MDVHVVFRNDVQKQPLFDSVLIVVVTKIAACSFLRVIVEVDRVNAMTFPFVNQRTYQLTQCLEGFPLIDYLTDAADFARVRGGIVRVKYIALSLPSHRKDSTVFPFGKLRKTCHKTDADVHLLQRR